MKNHKRVERTVDGYQLNGPLTEESFKALRDAAEGLKEPTVEWNWRGEEFIVQGWRPMTQKEIAQSSRRAMAAKKRAVAKKREKEERERALYEQLRKKYE